ncbi:MAG TPA: hypothetical protein VL381_02790 [Rhodocyclaceae bacterium]|jgi:hypothetical protein|nr:hypothetical protein [Rhodocyclaceae bacterium]
MTNPSRIDEAAKSSSEEPTAMNRRKLLKLGAGTAPILMALASRSAFGCHSTTPSAFGSICNSRPDMLQASSGCSPNYWESNTGTNYWPKPYYSSDVKVGKTTFKATTFNSVFSPSPFGSTVTLLQVLKNNGSGNIAVARACIAALLNARSGKTPSSIISESDVIQIWHEYAGSNYSYYEPTAGVKWYANSPSLTYVAGANSGGTGGIIGYLNTTWT